MSSDQQRNCQKINSVVPIFTQMGPLICPGGLPGHTTSIDYDGVRTVRTHSFTGLQLRMTKMIHNFHSTKPGAYRSAL